MQNYKVNQKNTSADGTHLQGFVKTTYDDLVKLFGNPKEGSCDGKTTCEWIIEFEDATVATIHDWKVNFTSRDLYYWSVGGHSHRVLDLLKEATNLEPELAGVE